MVRDFPLLITPLFSISKRHNFILSIIVSYKYLKKLLKTKNSYYICAMKNDPKEKFTYTTEELEDIKEFDVTLMDGLDNELSCNWDDEYDNNLGDLILF
jgi:hypothetical protein